MVKTKVLKEQNSFCNVKYFISVYIIHFTRVYRKVRLNVLVLEVFEQVIETIELIILIKLFIF